MDTDQAKTASIVVIIALIVVGALISALITKLIVRVITIVVVLGLALFVYTQRSEIQDAAKKCDATVLGVHLTPSNPDVKARCQNLSN